MGKLNGYFRLIRPINCLMMGFAVIVGAALGSRGGLDTLSWVLFYGFVTGFMLTAASMAINDYYDLEIDAVNEPDRPIPSGAIKPIEALGFAFVLTALGFLAAIVTNIYCLIVAAVTWTAAVAYTTVGKRTGWPGNLLVSTAVAMPFIYGNFAIAANLNPNVLIFALIVFLSITGREIVKGIVDVKGDREQHVMTLAVRFGERKAAALGAAFFVLAILLSPIPLRLNIVSVWFIPLIFITDLGLAVSSLMLLKDSSRENARKIKKAVLVWFIFGLFAFVAGTLQ